MPYSTYSTMYDVYYVLADGTKGSMRVTTAYEHVARVKVITQLEADGETQFKITKTERLER